MNRNLEYLSDYSINLMQEIELDMNQLIKSAKFDIDVLRGINSKLITAKSEGINVDKITKEINGYRITLLTVVLKNNINILNKGLSIIKISIDDVVNEFDELNDSGLIDNNLVIIYNNFKNKYSRNELLIDIQKFKLKKDSGEYDLLRIINKLDRLKEQGIDVSDIENEIMD